MANQKHSGYTSFIPESQKNKEWHVGIHRDTVYYGEYSIGKAARCNRLYDVYLGNIDPLVEHSSMTVSDSGIMYPVDFISDNKILPLIEHMNAMFVDHGYAFSVNALSKTAIDRKMMAKLMLQVDYDLLPLALKTQEMTNVPMVQEATPKTQSELEAAKNGYKDQSEIVYQRMLDDFAKRFKVEMKRMVLFQDANIAGDCHLLLDYADGYVRPVMLRPAEVLYDGTATDPTLSDANFYVIARYMTHNDIYNRWDLTKEELEQIKSIGTGHTIQFGTDNIGQHHPVMNNMGPGGATQVLVTTVYWKDIRVRDEYFNEDRFGNGHYSLYDRYRTSKDKKPRGERGKKLEVEQIRFCTMIGDAVCPENGGYGLLDWVPRTVGDNWAKAAFPIISLVPRFVRGTQKSTVELLENLQEFRDRCMYMIGKAMKRDHGRAMVYDRSQMPEDYEMEDILYYLDTHGVAEIESRQFGSNAGYNQFASVDMSLPPGVKIYADLAQVAYREMQDIVGIQDSAMGILAGQNQSVGVTQMSVGQSTMRAQYIYRLFDIWTENVLTYAAGLLRMAIQERPEDFRSVVGDDGIEFIEKMEDFDLEDVGVVVEADSRSMLDHMELKDLIKFGAQNGMVGFVDAADLLMTRGNKERRQILARIQRETQQQRDQQAQMQQQAQQQQIQAQIAAKREELQAKAAMGDRQAQAKLAAERERGQYLRDIQNSKNAGEMRKAVQKERGDNLRAFVSG